MLRALTKKEFNDFVARKEEDAERVGTKFQEVVDNEPFWTHLMAQYIIRSKAPARLMMRLYDRRETLNEVSEKELQNMEECLIAESSLAPAGGK